MILLMVQKSQGQPPGMVLFYPINNGINYYQPQLVSRSRISEPPTVSIVTTLAPWLYRSQETVTRAGSRRLDNHRRNFEITSHQQHERSEKTIFLQLPSHPVCFFKGYLVPFFFFDSFNSNKKRYCNSSFPYPFRWVGGFKRIVFTGFSTFGWPPHASVSPMLLVQVSLVAGQVSCQNPRCFFLRFPKRTLKESWRTLRKKEGLVWLCLFFARVFGMILQSPTTFEIPWFCNSPTCESSTRRLLGQNASDT